jgi:hypothetical protein
VISGVDGASAGGCPAYWIGDKAMRFHPWPAFPLSAQSTINSTETRRLDGPASGIWKRPLTAPSLVATSWTTTSLPTLIVYFAPLVRSVMLYETGSPE